MEQNRKCLGKDRDAVLDMPFRLVIVAATLALMVPAVIGGWSSVDYIQTEQRIRSEITRVFAAGQRYVQAGAGGESIELSFTGGVHARLEYVIFGDRPGGPFAHAARYKLSVGQERIIIAKNPSVAIQSPDGGSIKFPEGRHTIQLECVDGTGIIVRRV